MAKNDTITCPTMVLNVNPSSSSPTSVVAEMPASVDSPANGAFQKKNEAAAGVSEIKPSKTTTTAPRSKSSSSSGGKYADDDDRRQLSKSPPRHPPQRQQGRQKTWYHKKWRPHYKKRPNLPHGDRDGPPPQSTTEPAVTLPTEAVPPEDATTAKQQQQGGQQVQRRGKAKAAAAGSSGAHAAAESFKAATTEPNSKISNSKFSHSSAVEGDRKEEAAKTTEAKDEGNDDDGRNTKPAESTPQQQGHHPRQQYGRKWNRGGRPYHHNKGPHQHGRQQQRHPRRAQDRGGGDAATPAEHKDLVASQPPQGDDIAIQQDDAAAPATKDTEGVKDDGGAGETKPSAPRPKHQGRKKYYYHNGNRYWYKKKKQQQFQNQQQQKEVDDKAVQVPSSPAANKESEAKEDTEALAKAKTEHTTVVDDKGVTATPAERIVVKGKTKDEDSASVAANGGDSDVAEGTARGDDEVNEDRGGGIEEDYGSVKTNAAGAELLSRLGAMTPPRTPEIVCHNRSDSADVSCASLSVSCAETVNTTRASVEGGGEVGADGAPMAGAGEDASAFVGSGAPGCFPAHYPVGHYPMMPIYYPHHVGMYNLHQQQQQHSADGSPTRAAAEMPPPPPMPMPMQAFPAPQMGFNMPYPYPFYVNAGDGSFIPPPPPPPPRPTQEARSPTAEPREEGNASQHVSVGGTVYFQQESHVPPPMLMPQQPQPLAIPWGCYSYADYQDALGAALAAESSSGWEEDGHGDVESPPRTTRSTYKTAWNVDAPAFCPRGMVEEPHSSRPLQ